MSARKSSRTIDLRKRKAGVLMRPLQFPQAPRPPQRGSSLRARRRRIRLFFLLALLPLIALLVYSISLLSYLPRYSIQNIAVVGAEEVSPKLIETYAETTLFDGRFHFLSRQNMFFYPKAEIARKVEQYFSRVRSAEVSRDSLLAQVITVTVEEREARGRWCEFLSIEGESQCYLVDEDGFIFAPFTTSAMSSAFAKYKFMGALPEAASPIGQTFLEGRFAALLDLLGQLEREGFSPLEVSVENSSDFSVFLSRGFELYVTFGADPQKIVRDLELVLASDALRGREGELEYVDLRFGNRVYYKFRGEDEQVQ